MTVSGRSRHHAAHGGRGTGESGGSAGRPSDWHVVDAGWLFVIAGVVTCAACILTPAARDVEGLRHTLGHLEAQERMLGHQLERYSSFLDEVDRERPATVRRLAAVQFNVVGASEQPVILATGALTSVNDAVELAAVRTLPAATRQRLTQDESTRFARPATRLERLTDGPSRLWVLGGSILCIFIGLLLGPTPGESVPTRSLAGRPDRRPTRAPDPPPTRSEPPAPRSRRRHARSRSRPSIRGLAATLGRPLAVLGAAMPTRWRGDRGRTMPEPAAEIGGTPGPVAEPEMAAASPRSNSSAFSFSPAGGSSILPLEREPVVPVEHVYLVTNDLEIEADILDEDEIEDESAPTASREKVSGGGPTMTARNDTRPIEAVAEDVTLDDALADRAAIEAETDDATLVDPDDEAYEDDGYEEGDTDEEEDEDDEYEYVYVDEEDDDADAVASDEDERDAGKDEKEDDKEEEDDEEDDEEYEIEFEDDDEDEDADAKVDDEDKEVAEDGDDDEEWEDDDEYDDEEEDEEDEEEEEERKAD